MSEENAKVDPIIEKGVKGGAMIVPLIGTPLALGAVATLVIGGLGLGAMATAAVTAVGIPVAGKLFKSFRKQQGASPTPTGSGAPGIEEAGDWS
ncbi:MAG: hypothetical protein WCH05_04485 [Chlorobiaceae bacterium]